jgi:hypothetical protein
LTTIRAREILRAMVSPAHTINRMSMADACVALVAEIYLV